MRRHVLLGTIVITCAVIFVVCYKLYEEFSYLNFRSRCFDCEKQAIRQNGPDGAWLANPSKMFSAENSGVCQTGDISGGFLGKPL